jgi:hypothetical protein
MPMVLDGRKRIGMILVNRKRTGIVLDNKKKNRHGSRQLGNKQEWFWTLEKEQAESFCLVELFCRTNHLDF